MAGKPADALAITDRAHERGADLGVLLQDLLDLVHTLTRLKSVPSLRAVGGVAGGRAHPRRRSRRKSVDGRPRPCLADAAERHRRGGAGRRPPRRRRDGAHPAVLRRRPAAARRAGAPPDAVARRRRVLGHARIWRRRRYPRRHGWRPGAHGRRGTADGSGTRDRAAGGRRRAAPVQLARCRGIGGGSARADPARHSCCIPCISCASRRR